MKKLQFVASAEDAGKRLDQFLAERLPEALALPASKAKVRKLIVAGAVYLNGRRIRIASKTLIPRAKIEAYVDVAKLFDDGRSRDRSFALTQAHILFEDEFILCVNKPPGLPTQPTLDEARDNLYALVKKYLSGRDKVAEPYVGLHHRLDRDTSGVVLFTLDPGVNAAVAGLFSGRSMRKCYQALTDSPVRGQEVPRTWSIRNYLGRAPATGGKKAAKFAEVRSGGDLAETDFALLEGFTGGLHVEARPKTGRTHQIRVHLAEYGIPILGDTHYGARRAASGAVSRVMLHAASLTFPHPVHKTEMTVRSPLPEDFLQCLASLKKPNGA